MKSESTEIQTTPQQEARSKLRKSFLKAVNILNVCTVKWYHKAFKNDGQAQQIQYPVQVAQHNIHAYMQSETCSILTYEQSTLTGTFSSWKPDGSEILIRDLKTPANIKMTSALLRTPDILAIQFDKPVQLPL